LLAEARGARLGGDLSIREWFAAIHYEIVTIRTRPFLSTPVCAVR
jgi:hypothetical protein